MAAGSRPPVILSEVERREGRDGPNKKIIMKSIESQLVKTHKAATALRNASDAQIKRTLMSLAEALEKNLTETHEPSKHAAHEDLYVAIRDAFNAAARKLQDYAQRQRGTVKSHISEPPSYPTAAQSENR